ncbi:MAG: phage tail tape measure protein [Candidatus Kapabacteria bacterium]|nr:phage tail tape measure protein [Candidatus Kapabacteria bacterium]
MAVAQIPIQFVPSFDVAALNAMLAALKQSLGFLGNSIRPIDAAKLNAELASLKGGVNDFANGWKQVEENVDKVSQSGANVNKAFQFNQITGAVTQVAGALQGVLQVGNEYEATLAAVGAVTGQSGDGLTKLGDGARELAKEFGGSASDNLKSYQGILSKLGPQVAENSEALKSMGTTVNTLSAASGDDAATSMSALVDTMLQLGLTTGDAAKDASTMVKVGDALAVSAKVGAAEIPQVAQSMLQVGVAAKGAKLGLEGTVSAIQVLSVGGKTGSEAGVALRNVLGMIQKASGPAEAAMGKLGTSSKELGQILTTQGLGAALEKIQGGMNTLGSAAEKNATLMEIFGTENASAAGILLDNANLLDSYKSQIEAGVQAGAAGTDGMVAQANARLGTAEAITKRIVAQVEDVFIGISQTMGSGVSAALTATAQLAPTITSLAGIKSIIPEGAVDSIKNFALNILTKLVPGLAAQAGAQTAVAASGAVSAAATSAAGVAAAESGVAAATGSTGFAALWAAITGPVGIAVAAFVAIGAAVYLLYENVEGFRNAVDNAIAYITAVWSTLSPLFEKVLPVLKSYGMFVFNFLTLPMQVAWQVIKAVAGALFSSSDSATQGAQSFQKLGAIVQWLGDMMNRAVATFDGLNKAVGAITNGIGGVVSALASGDITGAAAAFADAGKGAVNAFQDGFNESYNAATTEDLKKKMQTDLEGGITINAKIEQTANFDELIKSYDDAQKKINELKQKKDSGQELTAAEQSSLKKLQDEAERTGQKIASIAPGAKEGMSVVRDESGKLREVFSINTDAAKKFGDAQKQAFAGDLKQSQASVSANLQQQSALYADQEKKLKQIAQSATEAAKAGKTDTARQLMKDYEDLRGKVEENGKALVQSFNDAGKAGLLTEDATNNVGKALGKTGDEAKKGFLVSALKDAAAEGRTTDKDIAKIAQKFGFSTDEAKRLLAEQQKQSKEASATAAAVSDIAKSFEEVKSAADNAVKDSLAKAKTTALQLQQARQRGDKDEAARLKRLVDAEIAAGKEAVKQKKNLEKLSDDIEIATGAKEAKKAKDKKDSDDTLFQRIKKRDEAESKILTSELELQKLEEVMSGKRRESDETELYFEQIKLESYQRNIELLKEKFGIIKDAAFIPQNISASVQAKIKPTERDDVSDFITKVNTEILQQQSKVKKLEVKTNLDAEKLRAEYRKLELQRLEQDVELNVVLPDNYSEYANRLMAVQSAIAAERIRTGGIVSQDLLNQEAELQSDLSIMMSDATTDAVVQLQEQRKERRAILIAEYTKDIDAVRERLRAAEQAGDSQQALTLIGQLGDLQGKVKRVRDEGYKSELAELDDLSKQKKSRLAEQLKSETDYNKNYADILSKRGAGAIERNTQKAIADLEAQKRDEIITEEQFNEQKAAIEQLAIQDKESLQNLVRGRELAAEREHTIRVLEEEQSRLEQKKALALKYGDAKAAEELTAQLDDVNDQLSDKKDVFMALGDEFQVASNEFVGGIFQWDEDAVKAPLRKMFDILVGFLTRLASAKIIEVLLGSLVGAAGIPGMFATFLAKPLIEAGVGAVLNPVLSQLVSFGTGGIVDRPTLAVVGDRNAKGTGDMTELILGSDQLALIMSEVLSPVLSGIRSGLAEVREAIDNLQFKLSVSGSDLVTATDRARTANNRRAIQPYSTVSTT